MIPTQHLIYILPPLLTSYMMAGIFVWYIEKSLNKIAVQIIESSKHVKNQRELLAKCKKSRSPLNYIFWPLSLFK